MSFNVIHVTYISVSFFMKSGFWVIALYERFDYFDLCDHLGYFLKISKSGFSRNLHFQNPDSEIFSLVDIFSAKIQINVRSSLFLLQPILILHYSPGKDRHYISLYF